MDVLNYIEIIAGAAGIALSLLLCAFPRFGPSSWMLVLTLAPASFASAIQGLTAARHWPPAEAGLWSFGCLLLCASAGCVTSYTFERADFRSHLRKHLGFFATIAVAAPLFIAGIYLFRPPAGDPTLNLIALGPVGYASAGYLLLISVVIIANVEQTLRSAEEHVRWEVKFLALGLASMFAAIIYIASQVLLYPLEFSFLPLQALRVFPVIFLCACLLILQSWRRSTGKSRIVVSHGVIYSTITLFSVGVYLVATSLVTRWLSVWVRPPAPIEPIIFLVSAIVLSAVLLGTAFRHRARRWLRQNVFAGNYDYRQLWMDATE